MKKKLTMGRRLQILLESGLVNRGGQCLDLYNMAVHDDIFVTVTTKVDASIYYVTEEKNN